MNHLQGLSIPYVTVRNKTNHITLGLDQPRPQAPPYAGEGPGIHCLRMRQVIRKFHCKIFRVLIQTRGKTHGVAKRSKYTVHTWIGHRYFRLRKYLWLGFMRGGQCTQFIWSSSSEAPTKLPRIIAIVPLHRQRFSFRFQVPVTTLTMTYSRQNLSRKGLGMWSNHQKTSVSPSYEQDVDKPQILQTTHKHTNI